MASEKDKRVSRSLSGDLDSDADFVEEAGANGDHSTQPGKPGRKKNPNSQAARRDQNRIAQREFRLRKQQRIRDLEARVEILSGSKDETYIQMRDIINELINENQTLRNMVRGLSGFIGDGAGGFLPRLGWTLKDFESFINRADTDTAFEAFAKRKRALTESVVPGTSSPSEKRPPPDDTDVSRKRPRTTFDNPGDMNFSSPSSVGGNSFGQSPYNATSHSVDLYPGIRAPFPASFLSGLNTEQQHGSSPFMSGGSSGTGLGAYSPAGVNTNGRDVFPGSFPAGPSAGAPTTGSGPSLQGMSYLNPAPSGPSPPPPLPRNERGASEAVDEELLGDPKAQEARKLVGYHLDNYRRNSAYCLPPSLRPTLVQRTVEHEGIIDGIPHPELRNRMILLRGRFNLADCIHDYLKSTIIHGDDVLGHANWEIQENWLKKYGYLVDPMTLGLTNRWRKERGDSEISLSDIASTEQLPGMAPS